MEVNRISLLLPDAAIVTSDEYGRMTRVTVFMTVKRRPDSHVRCHQFN